MGGVWLKQPLNLNVQPCTTAYNNVQRCLPVFKKPPSLSGAEVSQFGVILYQPSVGKQTVSGGDTE